MIALGFENQKAKGKSNSKDFVELIQEYLKNDKADKLSLLQIKAAKKK